MSVISNTSPLNYLALLNYSDLLPKLYGTVMIPPAVLVELKAANAPAEVKAWVGKPPSWLMVQAPKAVIDPSLEYLGKGEQEAIMLASERLKSALIIDDRDGRREAVLRRIQVIGTLGVIVDAAECGLIEIEEAIQRLQQTTFRASPRLLKSVLDRFK